MRVQTGLVDPCFASVLVAELMLSKKKPRLVPRLRFEELPPLGSPVGQ